MQDMERYLPGLIQLDLDHLKVNSFSNLFIYIIIYVTCLPLLGLELFVCYC